MDRRQLMMMGAAAAGGSLVGSGPAQAEDMRFPAGFLWGTASSAYQVEGRVERAGDCI